MSNKTWLNYALDVVIGLAFILTAASGLVFLLAGSGGYQGGRNPDYWAGALGVSRVAWRDLHNWTGLVMAAGVLLHLLLHWRWIFCMTKRLLRLEGRAKKPGNGAKEECPVS